MRTRNMVEEDAGVVAELCAELGYPTSEDELRRRFHALAGSENHELLVALDDGENVVGWVHAHVPRLLQTDSVAQIRALVVEKAHRGGGFGRLLMVEAEGWAKKQGCGEVHLRSNASREDAHRFYEALGYEKRTTSHVLHKSLKGHRPVSTDRSDADHDRVPLLD